MNKKYGKTKKIQFLCQNSKEQSQRKAVEPKGCLLLRQQLFFLRGAQTSSDQKPADEILSQHVLSALGSQNLNSFSLEDLWWPELDFPT